MYKKFDQVYSLLLFILCLEMSSIDASFHEDEESNAVKDAIMPNTHEQFLLEVTASEKEKSASSSQLPLDTLEASINEITTDAMLPNIHEQFSLEVTEAEKEKKASSLQPLLIRPGASIDEITTDAVLSNMHKQFPSAAMMTCSRHEKLPIASTVNAHETVIDMIKAMNTLKRALRTLEVINDQTNNSQEPPSSGYFYGMIFKEKKTTGWNKRQIEALHSIDDAISQVRTQQERLLNTPAGSFSLRFLDLPDTRGWQALRNEELKQILVSFKSDVTQANESLDAIAQKLLKK